MKEGKILNATFFMKKAIKLATEHMKAGDGGPFGAIIVREGKIIAEGWNRVTTSNDPTAHAEIVCIRRACTVLKTFDLSGCELFVNCEPCPMCLSAAYWAKIEHITFGADHNDAAAAGFNDAFVYEELQKKLPDRMIPMQQLLRNEALQTFELWDRMEGKIQY